MTIQRQDILSFFLDLYKIQMNAATAPGQFRRMEEESGGIEDVIYELRLKKDGRWLSRRMSIGPLGEKAGSKSTCYRVIYDDILVVKIPPKPITDFNQYLAALEVERRVAGKLTPEIHCVTPGVSAILKRIPHFSRQVDDDPTAYEARCVELLRVYSEYQRYLKIGGHFALFMNLARYPFLGQVMTRLTDIRESVFEEIRRQSDLLTDPVRFDELMERETPPAMYDSLQTAFAAFEAGIAPLAREHGVALNRLSYKKAAWFQIRLAEMGERLAPEALADASDDLPLAFLTGAAALLDGLVAEHKSGVEAYRKQVARVVHRRTFDRNRPLMAGITANLLRMLAQLRRMGVAMRDLKPDNLFIMGDISASESVLSMPNEYGIGLIDFETAVDLQPEEREALAQPMLGGTPSYATPTHLVPNEVIGKSLGNIQRILHIQDWQAVCGMIFKLVTGKHLYWDAGRLLPGISDAIRSTQERDFSRAQLFKIHSRIFWYHALREFDGKRNHFAEMLTAVNVELPWNVKRMFAEELDRLSQLHEQRLQRLVYSQQIFKSPQTRKTLLTLQVAGIERHIRNWEQGVNVPSASATVRGRVLRLMRQIATQRRWLDTLTDWRERMERRCATMTCLELLDLTQRVVYHSLYKESWGPPAPEIGDITFTDMAPMAEETFIATDETAVIEKAVTPSDR